MDKKIIEKVTRTVNRKYPETMNIKPVVRKQSLSKNVSSGKLVPKTYLLTYHVKIKTTTQKTINKYIRAVADENGKIIKISSSK